MTDPLNTIQRPIFVFGSNTAGRHGAGAALFAAKHRGAIRGIGEGMQGVAYAIPTKKPIPSDPYRLTRLPLSDIRFYVDRFRQFSENASDLTFEITAIGTGLSGYSHAQIAPMFRPALDNWVLPTRWRMFIGQARYHDENIEP